MPNLDRTGPQGQGPLTGRSLGQCRSQGAVVGRPRFSRGLRCRRFSNQTKTSSLRDELEAIKKRLNKLEK